MAKTSMNLEENVASALCYLGLIITGIIFYIIETENKTVRFHAMQSILVSVGIIIVTVFANILIWFVPFVWFLYWLVNLLVFILWLVLMIKAFQGEKFKLPVVGDIAEKQVK